MVQPGLRVALMTADVRKQGCQINRRRLVLRKLIFFLKRRGLILVKKMVWLIKDGNVKVFCGENIGEGA